MAVRIRLARHGRKKKPFYKVVVVYSESPRDGRFIETVGTYDPMVEPKETKLKEERIVHWLLEGAKPSETVKSLLKKMGVWQVFKTKKAEKESAA